MAGGKEIGDAAQQRAGGVALSLIDLINRMDFDGGDRLRKACGPAAKAVLRLRAEADRAKVPVIYVNDNFGHWHSERSRIVEGCMGDDSPTRDLVRSIAPRPTDYFVVKPHLSGFYATSLPVLLPRLGVSRLVLTGVAADICVLFTAADAHMRAYDLWVPRDAVAAEGNDRTDWALDIMGKSMGAETRSSADLSLVEWVAREETFADAATADE